MIIIYISNTNVVKLSSFSNNILTINKNDTYLNNANAIVIG